MGTPELDVIKDNPGYRVILKAILKSQIQQLVEQLAAHTEEESVILTASVSDGTLSHLGSDSGKNFLEDHEDIKSQFLGFCLRKHHKKKQQEKEDKEREEAMRNLPTTPTRQQSPRFAPRSPRFPSPRQQGVYPMALTRASPGVPVRMRPEPCPRPMKRPMNLEQQGPAPNQPPMKMPMSGQVIKIEADDDSVAASSHTSSPSQTNIEAPPTSRPPVKTETSDKDDDDDDAKSDSSTSTIPNEASDLKSDSVPPMGLSLGSDLSSLIPPNEDSLGGDNQQPGTPYTSSSAPQTPGSNSGLDSSVNVKVEAITESEMELEITGVELGPRPVQRGNSQESWAPNVSAGAMGYSGGAAGSQADMQQGYSMDDAQFQTDMSGDVTATPQGNVQLHMCPYCGKMFGFKSSLKRHVASHLEDKPFKCRICGKGCSQKANLKAHMLIKHKEENLSAAMDAAPAQLQPNMSDDVTATSGKNVQLHLCPYCRNVFGSKSKLNRHVARHFANTPFQCRICWKGCSAKANLIAHMWLKHKEVDV